MKINIVTPSFYPATIYGGPIFSTLNTCNELSNIQGLDVFVSTTNANMDSRLDVEVNKWISFHDKFNIKYYYETKLNVLSLNLLFNLWKDIKCSDIIHVQYMFSSPTPITLIYSKIFKKPVILSPRGALGQWCLNQGSRLKDIWLNWLIKPLAKCIYWHATSEQEKAEIQKLFPNAKVFVVSNGIDSISFSQSNVLNKETYMNIYTDRSIDASKIIVSIGRIQKKKGFDILIDAFFKVLEKHPNAKLLIAGHDEGEKTELAKQITELDLVDKAFLIGSIDGQAKIDFLANADLFVLPSHNENFGNVYIESLASGTPIIASLDTPWSEVVDSDCGCWVKNSVDDNAEAILKMLEKDRKQMRDNSKEFALKYDWKNIAIQFHNVFDNMLENHEKELGK